MKNVSVMTTQIVNIAKMIRLTKYFNVDGFILSSGLWDGALSPRPT